VIAARVSLLHFGELQMFVNQLLMGGTSEDDEFSAAVATAIKEDAPKQVAASGFLIMFATALWHSLESARWLSSMIYQLKWEVESMVSTNLS
jgi:hypothetical protein